MNRLIKNFFPVYLAVAFGMTMPGCTTFETSTDITTAPFDLTSSTSARTAYPHDPNIRAETFVAHNFEDLRQDMAQGRGEYIGSLGMLLGIPRQDLPQFTVSMQKPHLITEMVTPQAMWKVLNGERRTWPISAHNSPP